jgi:hypothetical protein
MKTSRWVGFIGIAVALVLVASDATFAQCAMCKAAIENSVDAEAASKGLNLASLVLLAPPVAIFSGLFGLIYRFRNVQGRRVNPADEQ